MSDAHRPATTVQESGALCPRCGHANIRITTSILAQYHVRHEAGGELTVLQERLGDAAWDEENPAACEHCGWAGTVSQVRRSTSRAGS